MTSKPTVRLPRMEKTQPGPSTSKKGVKQATEPNKEKEEIAQKQKEAQPTKDTQDKPVDAQITTPRGQREVTRVWRQRA